VKFGLMSRRVAMVGWMQDEARLFRGFTAEEFEQMAEWVVRTEMWPKRCTAVLSEFDKYRRDGTRIVLVSSAYQPIVDVFAQRIDAQAIGSPLIYGDGRLEGVGLPINAYENKAKYIRDKYPHSDILAAFGDTGSDIPMMELSQEPVAVNPDEDLRDIAETRGWRIIECSPGFNAKS
jgi:phosphoserine phosphatase